ncbi:MAG TPA: M13 family metallopeptidase [Bryobacteraceae bacterium]|nr:M13 family metallopeptidase [Bryobacteraceae bacterium]
MRLASLILLFGTISAPCFGQQSPLTALPQTPALDTGFLDKTADPCVNFYQYACGNWIKQNPMPPDQAAWDVYAKLGNDNQRFLWGILQTTSQAGASRNRNEQRIGDYFHACMDEGAVERAGPKPLEPLLARIANLNSVDDMASYVAVSHRQSLGASVLFDFNSSPDFDNSSQQMAEAGAGGLGLPDRDYYLKTDAKSIEIRQRYVDHVARMLGLLGESNPDAQADAKTVLAIETSLAQASLTRVQKRDPYNLKHKMRRADLLRLTPAFDWDVYLKAVGAPAFENINVAEPKFFEAVNAQLTSHKLADWRAYLRWHLVHEQAPFLSSPFVQENFAFYSQYLAGAKELPARWKKCTRLVDEQLGDALGQVFVARTFAPETKADAQRMIQQIEAEMGDDLKNLSWMSDITRQQALEKLHALVNKVGYPNKWRDYASVHVTADDFHADATSAAEYEVNRQLQKIGHPVDRAEWHMTPPTVNAYYDPQTNDINFPAGVLQPPLFDPKSDAAPNFGNTGATMGHEPTHAFDDEGRQFDAQGNLRDWWTPADAKSFEQRVACVRNQYAQYVVVDDIHINSSLTLGEDVADLGGTLLAYLAWKHATAGQDLKPLEDLTPDQRFFVGMAQWACGEERPEVKRMMAITNPHSPLEYRINGVVSNLTQFAAAFGCQAGQPMVNVHACRVW